MKNTLDTGEQRRLLREQLHAQRVVLISMLNLVPVVGDDSFPRSMIMRMLSGKSTLLLMILAKVVPLLLARYIGRSAFRK